jgi:uncharacterized protein (DUF362 family)
MSNYSRRDFLTHSAAAAGMLALRPDQLLAADAAAAAKPADMTIAKWAGAKELNPQQLQEVAVKLTEKAIEGLGGLKRFVSKGDVVWVKPNIGWDKKPEMAANNNPDVVATIVRLCFEAGAKAVKIGDNPCNKPPATYENSGIAPAVRKLGAEVLYLDTNLFQETEIKGERYKTLKLAPEILACDLVINVAVPKHHSLSTATVCMKNYMGLVDSGRRGFHQDIGTSLADITRFMKPRICIVDAIRVLTAHGPQGGNLADVLMKTTVAAGVDIVALDALGVELLGHKPSDIKTVVKGQEAGLGKMDYRSLALKEFAVS